MSLSPYIRTVSSALRADLYSQLEATVLNFFRIQDDAIKMEYFKLAKDGSRLEYFSPIPYLKKGYVEITYQTSDMSSSKSLNVPFELGTTPERVALKIVRHR